ncbi:MAG TPA: hypothetical protein VER96_33820 [Polyangiaceae bacterium]|nr:hypothetical protein [Polyangiaceae bacterium]
MSIVAGDAVNYNAKSGKRDRIELEMRATVTGGAGVIVSPLTAQDDPGMTVTRGGSAGLYNITFPASADALCMGDVMLISPAGTVKGFYWTAMNANAGTASFQTTNAAGAATDPAAADSMVIQLFLSRLKDL